MGVIVAFVAIGLMIGDTSQDVVGQTPVDAPTNPQDQQVTPAEPEVARLVGTPGALVDVAGVSCSPAFEHIQFDSSPEVVLNVWNDLVVASNEACATDFASVLGSEWTLNHPTLAVLNESGSIYELTSVDGAVSQIALYLTARDADHRSDLQAFLDTLAGTGNVDWSATCSETDRDWSGVASGDGLFFELSACKPL